MRGTAAELARGSNDIRRSSARTTIGGLLLTTAGVGPAVVTGLVSQSLVLILASGAFGLALLVGLLLLAPSRRGR